MDNDNDGLRAARGIFTWSFVGVLLWIAGIQLFMR
jgi:hypothetical protein